MTTYSTDKLKELEDEVRRRKTQLQQANKSKNWNKILSAQILYDEAVDNLNWWRNHMSKQNNVKK